MVDKKRRGPDVVPLTLHDLEMLQGPRSEWSLTARPGISLTDMTTGIVPMRANLSEGRGMYGDLAKAPLSVFSATKEGSQDKEFIMVGPSLTAEQVNGLMYFAAPYKGYGFDTQDIIDDWAALYNDPAHAGRKKAHAMMPGWSQFEASRESVLGVLARNFKNWGFNGQDKDDVIIPVLRWRQDSDRNNSIILEPLDEELQSALAQALPQQITDTDRLDSGMGMMFVAAYSPEQTLWPSSDGYKHSDSSSTQTIGPTQVLAYAYREVAKQQADASHVSSDQDIQGSMLLSALSSYAETGKAPIVDISGVSVDEFYEPELSGSGGKQSNSDIKPLIEVKVPANIDFSNVTENLTTKPLFSGVITLYGGKTDKPQDFIVKPNEYNKYPEEQILLKYGEEVQLFELKSDNLSQICGKNKGKTFAKEIIPKNYLEKTFDKLPYGDSSKFE